MRLVREALCCSLDVVGALSLGTPLIVAVYQGLELPYVAWRKITWGEFERGR